MVWLGVALYGVIWSGVARHNSLRFGLVWLGLVFIEPDRQTDRPLVTLHKQIDNKLRKEISPIMS